MTKKNNSKNWVIRVSGLFFISSFIVLFFFSDYFLELVVENTVLWFYIQNYRWILILIALTLVLYFLLQLPYKSYRDIENRLEENNKNYRLVVDNLKDEYFFYRHERNTPFKYLSNSVTNVLGYSVTDFKEIYSSTGASGLYENCFERHSALEFNDIKQPPFEIEIKSSNGSNCTFEVKEIAVSDEKGHIVAIEGIARNITLYKNAERELTEREKKYHALFESATDGFFVMKDDKFIDCNRKINDIFQCSPEEMIMHTPYHYRFSPPQQPDGRASVEKAKEKIDLALSGAPQKFEWVHLRNASDPFYTEIYLNKFTFNNEDYILAIVRDITEKKQSDARLEELIVKYNTLKNNNFIGIAEFNNYGIITDCNSTFHEVFKTGNDTKALNKISDNSKNAVFKDMLVKCCEGGKADFFGEIFNAAGENVKINASFFPVSDSGNTFVTGICIIKPFL